MFKRLISVSSILAISLGTLTAQAADPAPSRLRVTQIDGGERIRGRLIGADTEAVTLQPVYGELLSSQAFRGVRDVVRMGACVTCQSSSSIC
jgi:hypothetical protein